MNVNLNVSLHSRFICACALYAGTRKIKKLSLPMDFLSILSQITCPMPVCFWVVLRFYHDLSCYWPWTPAENTHFQNSRLRTQGQEPQHTGHLPPVRFLPPCELWQAAVQLLTFAFALENILNLALFTKWSVWLLSHGLISEGLLLKINLIYLTIVRRVNNCRRRLCVYTQLR